MDRETTVLCPHCGKDLAIPAVLRDVSVGKGGGSHVAVLCPHCASRFDAAAEAVTSSTVGGRLRLVTALRDGARVVLDEAPSSDELRDLVAAMREAATAQVSVADAVGRLGRFPRLERWARQNPAQAQLVATVLPALLAALVTRVITPAPEPPPAPRVEVTIERPSDSELQQLIDEAVARRMQEQAADSPAP